MAELESRPLRAHLPALLLKVGALSCLCEAAAAETPPAWTLGGTYTADFLRNTHGGLAVGDAYLDNLDVTLSIDGERAFGIPGLQLFAYGLYNNATRFSEVLPGDAMTASNIDAPEDFQLYEFWADWSFGKHASSLRLGLYDLNSEFDVSDARSLFINSSFGVGHELGQTGVNGPSIFPATSLAIRAAFRPSANWSVMAAAFDGVPGSSTDDGHSHLHLGGEDGALLIAEAQRQGTRVTKFALGAWHYTKSFDRIDDVILEVAQPRQARSSGAYALADLALWQDPDNTDRRVESFARIGVANGAVNEYDSNAQLGVIVRQPFSSSASEALGLAITSARTGSSYRQAQQLVGDPIDKAETAVELTYRRALTPWLTIQPDLQWILSPGASRELRNALVVGLRVEMSAEWSR